MTVDLREALLAGVRTAVTMPLAATAHGHAQRILDKLRADPKELVDTAIILDRAAQNSPREEYADLRGAAFELRQRARQHTAPPVGRGAA